MFSSSVATLAVALTSLVPLAYASTDAFKNDCTASCIGAEIAKQNHAVTVNIVEYVPAGTNITFPDNDPSCGRSAQVVAADMCRIAMNVNTSSSSQIFMEAWLPRDWSGRFLSTGDGGLAGCVQYEDVAYGVNYGFATVGANGGQNGTSGKGFYDSPGTVEDFSYRSVHTGVVVGKQIVKDFYGTKQKYSYYLGCSTGGRQGFKEVQMFPNDFDGVVAGAPAFDFNHLTAWSEHFYSILGPSTAATFVPANLWPIIHNEILAQCDGLDGAVDGIIEDPELCYWRPEALICPTGTSTNCLTGTQAAAVRQVFEPYYGLDGNLIYPRMQPGGELLSQYFYYNGQPFIYSTGWYEYGVLSNLAFTPANFTLDLVAYTDTIDSTALSNISTWSGDLSAFQSSGGKLLSYHGQQDWLISSSNSPRYYNHVAQTMGLTTAEMDDFYRFFRVSGMGHCGGGPGAWEIGQTAAGNAAQDPDDNVLMRIVAWVEQGQAPEFVRGTKYVNDTASLGVEFKRKHCKYPARNVYVGPGKYTNENAWECVADSF